MSDSLQEFILKENEKAKKEGKSEAQITFATRLLNASNMTNSEVALMTDLSLTQVEKLAKKIRNNKVAN